VSVEEALAMKPATEDECDNVFTYTAFDTYDVHLHTPVSTKVVAEAEQSFCLRVSNDMTSTVALVDQDFESFATVHTAPQHATESHKCYYSTASIPKSSTRVYLAAKVVVGSQLRYDVFAHYDVESVVHYHAQHTTAEEARKAMETALGERDFASAATHAKVVLSLLTAPDYDIILLLACAHQNLSQHARVVTAADTILTALSPAPSPNHLSSAHLLKAQSLLARGFNEACVLACVAGCEAFPDLAGQLDVMRGQAEEEMRKETSPTRWVRVDEHAMDDAMEGCRDVGEVTRRLCDPFTKDTDKVRAIFRWICDNISYDVENLRYGTYANTDLTPEGVLTSRRAVCEGYCILFTAMLDIIHVECGKVVGWGRSGLIKQDSLTVPNHMWNAFKLDGAWQLADVTWSAGSLNPDFSFNKEFNPYYFMTDASQFSNSHFPEDPQWQMVTPALNKTDFCSSLYFTSHMYLHGIKTETHKEAELTVTEGETIKIKLSQMEGRDRIYLFPQVKVWGSAQLVPWDAHATYNVREKMHCIVVDTSGAKGACSLTVFFSTEEVGSYTRMLQYKITAV